MTVNKILRYGLFIGIFAVPFVPLIVANSMFFPFITGKNFMFRILVELMLGGWIILALRDVAYRPRFSWILAAFAVFVGIIALADIFGENPLKSFWSNFERMEGLVTLLHLFAYLAVVGTMLNAEKLWTRFWHTTVGVSTVIALYGLLQLAGTFPINQGGVRLDATLGNATYLAVYMLFHVFITLLLLARWQGTKILHFVYGSIIVLQLIIIYFTATRGAILGLLGGILLTALLISLFERQNLRIRKIAIGTLIAVVVLIGGFAALKNTDFIRGNAVLSRLAQISIDEGSTRFQVWNMGVQGFKERPILGWGQENFNFVFNKYYEPRMYSQEPWFDRVHNIFFDWLIAGGILGLLAYLSLFATALYYLWRRREGGSSVLEKSIFTGLFAGYFFHNLFVFDNITSYILFFSILAYIHFQNARPIGFLSSERLRLSSGTVNRIVVPAVIVVMLFGIYFFNAKGILASNTLLRGLSAQEGGIERNVELFRKAIKYDSFGQQEIREQLIQVAFRANTLEGVELATRQELFNFAREEIEKQIERQPNDARLNLFKGSFLRTFGQYDLALIALNEAQKFSPQKQQILFEIGLTQLLLDDRQAALETLKDAFELEPEYSTARLTYAVAAVYNGRNDLVEELLVPVYGTVLVDDDILIQAYFDTGQIDKVIGIWEFRVDQSPNNAQYRVSLAASYLQAGLREQAIGQLERAIELNPDFKEQGEFFIQEIRAGRNP